jgi:hypothetical protein
MMRRASATPDRSGGGCLRARNAVVTANRHAVAVAPTSQPTSQGDAWRSTALIFEYLRLSGSRTIGDKTGILWNCEISKKSQINNRIVKFLNDLLGWHFNNLML